MANAQNVAKDFKEFAYVVSHDLGAPLRAVVEFSQMLRDEYPDDLNEESELYLSMILKNGRRAQEMLAGLLEFSRLNTVVMPLVLTDCNALLSECQDALAQRIADVHATLLIGDLPTLPLDGERMKSLFMALLSNALIFHRHGIAPEIAVRAEQTNEGWQFTVADNGIGIDAKFYERIFQPFRRLQAEGEYPGTGMGLTLARKIIDRHGGAIWVESALGRGSSFIFTIPARQ